MEKILVIIPTYNEIDNIESLIDKVFALKVPNLAVLVVDDNSPDGTGECVANLGKNNGSLHLIRRQNKLGLGTAYVDGFKYAIKQGYDFIFEMDADHSHDPQEIPKMLHKARSCDLVIGSRYLTGVNVINWPFSRLLISLMANFYTRLITRMPIHDCTSGFKCFRRRVLESINLDRISSDGYSFQIEMAYKAWRREFKIVEHPIIFVDRTKGASKMTYKVMREATWMVWKLRLLSLLHKLRMRKD
ncbi:MAG: polyprenol monophosphomannose synthase [bacterium]